MADLQDLNDPNTPAARLQCDRAIFTSLPSRTGEGYRLVAWSGGLRPEERQELTRRAPSHGSLSDEATRGLLLFRLQSTGRAGWGFVRVSGTEHTRRGGGRVWTDFLVGDAGNARAEGRHPDEVRAALVAEPAPKPPLGGSPLARIGIVHRVAAPSLATGAAAIAVAAKVALLLAGGRACVIAAGGEPAAVFEDALRMLPAAMRGDIDACAGLRFSPARGVKATLTDRIDQDTVRATRGQGVECLDLAKMPAAEGPLKPWVALMSRWWSQQRGADAVDLADRLGAGWTIEQILGVAALCEAIDRGDQRAETLDELLSRRSAA